MSAALKVFFQFLIPYLLIILDRKSRGGMSGLEFHSIAGMSISNVNNVGKDLWYEGKCWNMNAQKQWAKIEHRVCWICARDFSPPVWFDHHVEYTHGNGSIMCGGLGGK